MNEPEEITQSPIREMYGKLAILYSDYYLKHSSHSIIRFSVVCHILSSFYKGFVDSNEIIPLEDLSPDVKQRLWDIAGEYHLQKELRIKASKAAYVLEVVSLNN